MDLELRGKSVLITGASKGIGLACAQAFAADDADAHLASRSAEELTMNAADITAQYIGKSENVMALAQTCGDVDILVNNAGAIPGGDIMQVDEARWKEIQAEVFKALPFKRSAYPAEVADLVTFLASARAAYISATVVTIDAGQSLRQRTY